MSCTVKNIPYLIEHTIQYARNLFEKLLVNAVNDAILYIQDPQQFLAQIQSGMNGTQIFQSKERVDGMLPLLRAYQMKTKDEMYKAFIEIARNQFEHLFQTQIQTLIRQFPQNAK